jgi:hypothetical protein
MGHKREQPDRPAPIASYGLVECGLVEKPTQRVGHPADRERKRKTRINPDTGEPIEGESREGWDGDEASPGSEMGMGEIVPGVAVVGVGTVIVYAMITAPEIASTVVGFVLLIFIIE